ncbi:helix-turn-helix transcriptional regulator [Actinosynnema sp. NPDC020468]|uniref:helix-turn-helix domain-containing protein n=1 Tax=Actinosynnema sp. NPDC020468 TaxID=3154488 RepID=UPI0033E06F55
MTTAAREPAVPLPPELAAALRQGSFHDALDLAIRLRGLSLEAVQRRMSARGARVSQATLSYWRRGRRSPEGERSLRAVRALEDCLVLPRDALVRLIGPQRPRGRWIGHVPGTISLATALELEPTVLTSCDGIDLDGNNRLSIVSLHEHVRIDADRAERSVVSEMVVVSKADGVDRWVLFFHPQDRGDHRPTLVRTEGCRAGRVRTDPGSELLAVELRFDHPLRTGESYVFGYEIGYAGVPPQGDTIQYGLRTPARELLIQVSFDPATVPVRAYRFHRSRTDPDAAQGSELSIGVSATTHICVLDAPPGVHGIVWEWD